MSSSEEAPSNNALDALYALSRRQGERAEPRADLRTEARAEPPRAEPRAEPRLAAVNDAPVPRMPRPPLTAEARGEVPRAATPNERIENAMAGFVRSQFEIEEVTEPEEAKRGGARGMLVASIIGVAGAIAVVSVVVMLSVNVFPKEKDAVQSFAAAVPAAAPAARSDAAALSDFRRLVPPNGVIANQGFSHEQSERLLQQFVQWRQKSADKQ
jgi:hypothetical protein